MNIQHLLAAALFALSALARAETPDEARVHALIEPKMGKNVKVDAVTKMPWAGLYEVRTNGDIFYTDDKASVIVVGKVVDLTTYRDLTRERIDALAGIRFGDLPFDAAIKVVKGKGERVMAVFEDPNCPYCRKLHEHLQGLDNVTIYTFLLDILSDESAVKSRNIWCAPDHAQAWLNWIEHNVAAPAAPASCKQTPHERVLALGRQLKIQGTPTLYFADGSRMGVGYTREAIEAKLATVQATQGASAP